MSDSNVREIILKVNGDDAEKELRKIQGNLEELNKSKRDLIKKNQGKIISPEDERELKKLDKQINVATRSLNRMNAGAAEVAKTLENLDAASPKQLQKTLKALKAALSGPHMRRGSKEWQVIQEKIKAVKNEIQKVTEEQREAMSMSDRFAEWGQKWMGIAEVIETTTESLAGVKMAAAEAVQAFLEMDEAQVAVKKYTGLSSTAIRELNQIFMKMDTRTPREQLNALAADAGRLGITSKNAIIDFVTAANMINVALGEDLGDDAVKNIGKLAQLFGDDKKVGLKQAMISTASVVNDLAQSSSANEGYIMDFTARLAGMAYQAKMSQSQVMALAAVMDQAMVNAEEGSTALMKVIQQIYREPEKMAKAAGLEVNKFANLVKTDANEALLQFATAVSKLGGMDKIAPMLGELSLTGAGVSKAIATLANQVDKIRSTQAQANEAFRTGSSVLNEYNTANNSQTAVAEKNRKKIQDLRIELGEKLLPVWSAGLSTTSTTIKMAAIMLDFLVKHRAAVASVAVAVTLYTIALKRTVIAEKLHALWVGIISKKEMLMATGTVALNLAVTLFTKGLKAARLQFMALNAAMKTNVIGMLTVGLSMAVVAIVEFISRTKEAARQHVQSFSVIERVNKKMTESTQSEISRIQKLTEIINNSAYSYDTKKRAMLSLQKIVPKFHASLGKEIQLTKENTKAIGDYISQLKNKAKAEAYYEELVNAEKRVVAAKRKEWRKTKNIEAVQAEFVRNPDRYKSDKGALTATYNTSMGATSFYAGYGERNQDLIDKKAELKSQQEALNTARQERKKAEDEVTAINNLIKSEKGVLEAFDALIISGGTIDLDNNTNTAGGTGGSSGGKSDRLKNALDKIRQEAELKKLVKRMEYNNGIINAQQFSDDILNIDRERFEAEKNLYDQHSSEWIAAENGRLDAIKKMKDDEKAFSLHQIEAEAKAEELMLMQHYAAGAINEEQYQEQLTAIQLQAQKRRAVYLLANAPGSDEQQQAQNEYQTALAEDKLARHKAYLRKAAEFEQKYNEQTNEQKKAAELDLLDELIKEGVIAAEKREQYIKEIEDEYSDKDSKGDKSPLSGQVDPISGGVIAIGQAISNLDEKLRSGQASWQDYAAVAVGALGMVSTLMNSASQLMQANIDAETAKINKRYDSEIAAAGKNSKKAKKLEDQRQKEISAVKNKYAKKAMAMQMASAVAQTAISAINAYSSAAAIPLIGHIIAPIAAATAIAAGMIQIATIKKQQQAQAAGYYEGGFTGGNRYHKEAGVVHEGEWVANHRTLSNPNVLPLIEMLDFAQRTNRVASLTSTDVSRAVAAPQQTASVLAIGQPVVVHETERTSEALEKLSGLMDKGIPAYVVIDGPDGLKKQMDRYNKLTNI